MWSLWRAAPWRQGTAELVAHPRVAGFRALAAAEAGNISLGGMTDAVFLGLTPPGPAVPQALRETVARDPLAALYQGAAAPRMAYFTDIRCPICRPFEADLRRLEEETPGLSRITHELPVFGPSSTLAARALIAAGPELSDGLRMQLQRRPSGVTEESLARTLTALAADPAPVLARLQTAETTGKLLESRALADLFGFFGTPALVIGRTALLGAVSLPQLRSVLEQEMQG